MLMGILRLQFCRSAATFLFTPGFPNFSSTLYIVPVDISSWPPCYFCCRKWTKDAVWLHPATRSERALSIVVMSATKYAINILPKCYSSYMAAISTVWWTVDIHSRLFNCTWGFDCIPFNMQCCHMNDDHNAAISWCNYRVVDTWITYYIISNKTHWTQTGIKKDVYILKVNIIN